jgi:site-specific recombinase XerD
MRREIVGKEMNLLALRLIGDHLGEESDRLLAGVARGGLADYLAAPGVERGVQRQGPVARVFKTVALGPPRRQRQHRLKPVQGWDGGLFVDAKHRHMQRRFDVQPNNIRRSALHRVFTATIRNRNTRMAYARAVKQFFDWCKDHRLGLDDIEPIVIGAYIEQLGTHATKPTVKQNLAAIRQLFDYLVTGGILRSNPGSVRGPKYVVTRCKTPVLSADEMRQLLDSIDTSELIGLRDRALIGLMGYSFARVSAAGGLRVEDYFQRGRRAWLRLHDKGGKRHEVPCHHLLDEYLDAWIQAAVIGNDKKGPLADKIVGSRNNVPRTIDAITQPAPNTYDKAAKRGCFKAYPPYAIPRPPNNVRTSPPGE